MPTDDEKEYTGIRKPPKQTRFRKGQSGNPEGRPRGAQNMATLFYQGAEGACDSH
jgi:hypothetical protein